MDIRQLRYFLQIVETGSFSGAAEMLHVAQPSLSQHVRSLEDELGVELLSRHARGVAPTDFGRLLCEHARSILREVERAKDSIRSASDSPGGEVLVGLPTSACRGLAIPLIEAAAERFPRISIHLVEAMTGSLDEWVQTGRLDVALLYDHKAFEDIVANEVMIEELRLIVPAGHALAGERAIKFADLSSLPIVLPARPHVIRGVVEQTGARANLSINVAVNCDSLAGIVQLVRHGHVTLFPSFAMSEEIARGEFVAIPVIDPTPSWRLSIVLSKKSTNPRSSKAIAMLMDDVARGMVQQGTWNAQLKRLKRPN